MQQTQFGARGNPQVLIEGPAQPVERVEGLGLPPVPVKRDYQLPPPPFAHRATGHQALQPGVEQILERRFA